MFKEERFLKIINYLKQNSTASFSELAKEVEVSEATIRRDINELDKKSVLKKVRGGAIWRNDDLSKQVFSMRSIENRSEKAELVKALERIVTDGRAVALNGGTTIVEVAKFLAENYNRLTIITNNLNTIEILRTKKEFTVILPGGFYYANENTLVGQQCKDDISTYNVDVAILAVNAISLEKGITDFRMEEKGVMEALRESAEKVVVVADHTKFDRISCVNILGLDKIDYFITDRRIDSSILKKYREAGINIIIPD